MKATRNRLANVTNPYQGKFKKVLCVCSAGLLRSPTIAYVLSMEPFNFNTRAVGSSQEYALIPIDTAHVAFADEIVVVSDEQEQIVKNLQQQLMDDYGLEPVPVHNVSIPDIYEFRDPKLVEIVREKMKQIFM